MMDKLKKAVTILRGVVAVLKHEYVFVLHRERVAVVDPREVAEMYGSFELGGVLVHAESRGNRSWSDALLALIEEMGPRLEEDRVKDLTTAAAREEQDEGEQPACTNPNCPVHGNPPPRIDEPPGGQRGWNPPPVGEA
jgi:hypothetical protein